MKRRTFLEQTTRLGFGGRLFAGSALTALTNPMGGNQGLGDIPVVKKGEKQLLVDDVMIARQAGVQRRCHAARKLPRPVLEGDQPWEHVVWSGVKMSYACIYGTVLRDVDTGTFRMWYNCGDKTLHATSHDGVSWQKPPLGKLGANNLIGLFDFHSPSFILDQHETDPAKRYKAMGSKAGFGQKEITRLKAKFGSPAWFTRSHAYSAAYSADGLQWKMYPEPALLGMDTITLAQDPTSGLFLAFHKNSQDPRSIGRQIFLSVSRDLQSWSAPELVMATDETDHAEARKLEAGTHAEFYNMSAFHYANQWLGLVTRFRCQGAPLVNGRARPGQNGVIDVLLVHSRDGRSWQRCTDRSPVIPVGPFAYDAGMILGVGNTPVMVGDEMWGYYSAATLSHAKHHPDQKNSIARAAWRMDGLVSLQAAETEGVIETVPFRAGGENLVVNADVAKGRLLVELLNRDGQVVAGYEKTSCIPVNGSAVRQAVRWKRTGKLPSDRAIRLRFHLSKGDLYSYTIE